MWAAVIERKTLAGQRASGGTSKRALVTVGRFLRKEQERTVTVVCSEPNQLTDRFGHVSLNFLSNFFQIVFLQPHYCKLL